MSLTPRGEQHLTLRDMEGNVIAQGPGRIEFESVPAPEQLSMAAQYRQYVNAAYGDPTAIQALLSEGPRPENDELIASTRAEFPYDPYRYGRVYPEGPSRWTPPEDPDERIPSCPA